jgi:ubiquinone/menaquinone biosynthesis C-methylase UbiE
MDRKPHKFDPARAEQLERPERQEFLPNEQVLDLLELSGRETVIDYGAGSGVLTIPLAQRLRGGLVHAVEESTQMMQHLRKRIEGTDLRNVRLHLIQDNQVPLESAVADRILAVNLLHETVGETVLEEMRRLLAPEGFVLVVDWRADVEREFGPPREVAMTPQKGWQTLKTAGFSASSVEVNFPYHFVMIARAATDQASTRGRASI